MKPDAASGPLVGSGKVVEIDGTYVGGKAKNYAYADTLPKEQAVITFVEREGKVKYCVSSRLRGSISHYPVDFDLRYNNRKINNTERSGEAIGDISDKRLTYRRPHETTHA